MSEEFEVISSYSQAQAIEDGVLFDVSKQAREAGIKYPVTVTTGVQGILNDIGDSSQDREGRLWDLLMVFRVEARKTKGDTIYFSVLFQTPEGKMQEEKFWAKCTPGDTPEPVITKMLTSED